MTGVEGSPGCASSRRVRSGRSSNGRISAPSAAARDDSSLSNSRRSDPARRISTKVANAPRLSARVPTYQNVRRPGTVLNLDGLRIHDRITDAADGLDVAGFARFIDLVPQVLDVHVDDVAREIEREIPDVLGDHRARQHHAGPPHQVLEQRVLLRGECNRLA